MSLYFSLITPAPGCDMAALHQRLDGPYADHQWLWRWFPSAAGTARDFMFRRQQRDATLRFYVVSQRPPSARLGDWQADVRSYAPALQAGDRLAFELRANPTVRHGRDGKAKRHDVVMECKKQLLAPRGLQHWGEWVGDDRPALQPLIHTACTKWLLRQGQALGFEPDTSSLVVESYEQHHDQRAKDLRFTSVDFTGALTVTDPALLLPALAHGVGRAKAFGCGLLLVRRLD